MRTTKNTYCRYLFAVFYSFQILFLFSCADDSSKEQEDIKRNQEIQDSIYLDSIKTAEDEIKIPPLVINYRLDSLVDTKSRDSILGTFNEEQQKIIFALNRIEPVRVGEGTTLIIPDTLLSDFNKYAPFPESLKTFDSIPKVVLISQRVQAFGLYEKGELIRWGPVSSGKQTTPTPNGLHYGNYKAKRKVSTVNPDWILPYYFNFMNFEGVGVHQYLLPGFPASHACVRLYMDDAKFIYDWAKQWELDSTGQRIVKNGTPFIVFGEYDYKNPFPWLNLATDPESNSISEEELSLLKTYSEKYFQDEKNFRRTEKDSLQ